MVPLWGRIPQWNSSRGKGEQILGRRYGMLPRPGGARVHVPTARLVTCLPMASAPNLLRN
jgi:hypothetical protein